MLVDRGKIISKNNFKEYSFGDNKWYLNGLIFMENVKSGYDTIEHLNNIFNESGEIPFSKIFGAFSIFAKLNDEIISFTDNSFQHCLFLSNGGVISSSLIELIEYRDCNYFDKTAIAEYLYMGKYFFEKTFVDDVATSNPDKWYFIDTSIKVSNKDIKDIDSPDIEIKSFCDFFDILAGSISEQNVRCSLTGGYDSRLVFASMNNRMNVDPQISGSDISGKDISVAKKVASIANKELKVTNPDNEQMNEKEFIKLFYKLDGCMTSFDNANIRLMVFNKKFQEQGFDLGLTGDGGVLHKDWEWMQDFPFYKKKHTNLEKFFHQRMAFATSRKLVSNEVNSLVADKCIPRLLKRLEEYRRTYNSNTYDELYFHVNGYNVQKAYNIEGMRGLLYAPLWERMLVNMSYNLPRRHRAFYYNMKKSTTAENPLIAQQPTNYGMTSSSETRYLIRDIFFQGKNMFRKMCRMIGRKLFNKNVLVGNISAFNYMNEVREMPISLNALEYCKNNKLIKENINLEQCDDGLLGRIIHIYLLNRECKVMIKSGE